MKKLVISFDEMPKAFDPTSNTAIAFVMEFLEDTFPEWDIVMAFEATKYEMDMENKEIHIPMR